MKLTYFLYTFIFSVPDKHLTKWLKIALTLRSLPKPKSSINCLGWYCGRTGQANLLASNRPKSGIGPTLPTLSLK